MMISLILFSSGSYTAVQTITHTCRTPSEKNRRHSLIIISKSSIGSNGKKLFAACKNNKCPESARERYARKVTRVVVKLVLTYSVFLYSYENHCPIEFKICYIKFFLFFVKISIIILKLRVSKSILPLPHFIMSDSNFDHIVTEHYGTHTINL